MVPRKLQVSETFHPNLEILEWHLSFFFVSFHEFGIFELFAVMS